MIECEARRGREKHVQYPAESSGGSRWITSATRCTGSSDTPGLPGRCSSATLPVRLNLFTRVLMTNRFGDDFLWSWLLSVHRSTRTIDRRPRQFSLLRCTLNQEIKGYITVFNDMYSYFINTLYTINGESYGKNRLHANTFSFFSTCIICMWDPDCLYVKCIVYLF